MAAYTLSMSRDAWRPRIEDALPISVNDLRSLAPRQSSSGELTWTDRYGQRLLSAKYALILDEGSGVLSLSYQVIDSNKQERRTAEYVIRLDTTRPHLGGLRWWFRCPYTGRRARKLYLFPRNDKFCCRTALHPAPTYLIQRVSGLRRATLRRWALRERMGSDDSLYTLRKPKGMHQRTFAEYEQRDSELEREELLAASRRFGIDVCQLI